MRELDFPIIGTKVEGVRGEFELSDPEERERYFEAKVGREIERIREFLEKNTFVAYLIGKKNSGKGTYAKMFAEVVGEDKFEHVSVGDVVREVHENWEEFSKSPQLAELKRLYRGYISFDEAIDAFLGRTTEGLLPTEFVLALLKLHVSKLKGKSIFIDGLPREADQVSYSLFFRDLIDYRNDQDMFILIDIPESVIDERIKYRVVCPECQTSRNKKLLITSKVEYDEETGQFHLLCDNPTCSGPRMVPKEGDELGIETIRPRLEKDEQIIRNVFALHGVPKILLRNHIPASEADNYFDSYEITPEYGFVWDKKERSVRITKKRWTVKDDNGVECFSLLAPPVVVSLIKQLSDVLEL